MVTRVMRQCRSFLVFFASLLALASPSESKADVDKPYPLDSLSRTIKATGKMRCPKVSMQKYRGLVVRYHKPVYVYDGFVSHLTRFETIVSEVAKEIYGRAPTRIVHVGTYNCRRIRRYPDLLSEHGIGNAIDIEGFDFGRAKSAEERDTAPHKRLWRPFRVRVDKHWDKSRGVQKLHALFLRRVTEELISQDVFRVMLGPAYPGHQDHFHFDQAPYKLIEL